MVASPPPHSHRRSAKGSTIQRPAPGLRDGAVIWRRGSDAAALAPPRRIYYDATLIVHFGFETAVGLVRVDQYVAECLAEDASLDIAFVVFDAAAGGYRHLSNAETLLLRHILFHRYDRSRDAGPNRLPISPSGYRSLPVPPPGASGPHRAAFHLVNRVSRAAAMPKADFDTLLHALAVRWLPIRQHHSLSRRVATRVIRRTCLLAAQLGHRTTAAIRHVWQTARHLGRPDLPLGNRHASPTRGGQSAAAEAIGFEPGSFLLSMGNSWDYLDYGYLHRICRDVGVRFICVVYDVIAMQHPFTTPGPVHVYHRHWVEIGHCAEHLLAISRFSAEQYDALIAAPNDLTPSVSHAYLPCFLRDRADEIGEAAVSDLIGRRFVVFCSTIETRKNHQLLLHVWDRLRLEFNADELPILVFAGKWGWGTEAVRLLSERNFRLRRNLRILDRLSDAELIWIYRHARFSVFPSFSEGYGLAATESLSFGTPVVIANCPALIEATEGLMPAHDPLDFMAWLAEMRSLISDDARLDTLRSAAARYRGARYSGFADAVRALALTNSPAPQSPVMGQQCPVA